MTREEVIEALKAEVDKLKKDNINLIKYQDELENKILELENSLEISRKNVEGYPEIIECKNAEISSLERDNQTLRNEYAKLVSKLHETKKELEDAKEFDNLYKVIEERDEYIAELEKAIVNKFLKRDD